MPVPGPIQSNDSHHIPKFTDNCSKIEILSKRANQVEEAEDVTDTMEQLEEVEQFTVPKVSTTCKTHLTLFHLYHKNTSLSFGHIIREN